jgi:hypothetical protein
MLYICKKLIAMSTEEIKIALHESIENIDDNDFLSAIKQIIDRKYIAQEEPVLKDWQKNRIEESYRQVEKGKTFSNHQADLLVERWLSE